MLRGGEVDAEFEIILRDAAGSLYSGIFWFAFVHLCGLTCTSLRCCYRYWELAFYIHDGDGMVSSPLGDLHHRPHPHLQVSGCPGQSSKGTRHTARSWKST